MKLSRPEEADIPTPRTIFERLDRYVVGQERAKRAMALAAYNHLRRVQARRQGRGGLLRKSNVLLVGPTGCGKTLLAHHLAAALDVPMTVEDATEYTEAGYYGRDVELMITDLLARAGHSVERAQRGLVFVDEVDKIARRTQPGQNGAGARDIGGEGVQQALLKLLEGREVMVPAGGASPWARGEMVAVDTTDVLFVCAGTFSDLFGGLDAREPIGFGGGAGLRRRRPVRERDLLEFGMLAEFLGRLPVVVQLDELGPDELMRVLTEPPDALLREYRERLALDGMELSFTEEALRELVRAAIDRRVGARGLRAMFEEVCGDILFDAPGSGRRRMRVDAGWVRRRLDEARLAQIPG